MKVPDAVWVVSRNRPNAIEDRGAAGSREGQEVAGQSVLFQLSVEFGLVLASVAAMQIA